MNRRPRISASGMSKTASGRSPAVSYTHLDVYKRQHPVNDGFIVQIVENVADPASQFPAFPFLEATGRDRRRTDADAAGDKWRLRIVGYGILVDGDVGAAQRGVSGLAGQALSLIHI